MYRPLYQPQEANLSGISVNDLEWNSYKYAYVKIKSKQI